MVNIRYRLIDSSTGTVLERVTASDIAQMLGVSKHYVTSCARNNNLIQCRYKVEMVEIEEVSNKPIPNDLWAEWDKVCKPLNMAIKKSGKQIKLVTLG